MVLIIFLILKEMKALRGAPRGTVGPSPAPSVSNEHQRGQFSWKRKGDSFTMGPGELRGVLRGGQASEHPRPAGQARGDRLFHPKALRIL